MSIKELKKEIKELLFVIKHEGTDMDYETFSKLFKKCYSRDEFAHLFYDAAFDRDELSEFERKKIDEYFRDADFKEEYNPELQRSLFTDLLEKMEILVENYENTIEAFKEINFEPKELVKIIAEYNL